MYNLWDVLGWLCIAAVAVPVILMSVYLIAKIAAFAIYQARDQYNEKKKKEGHSNGNGHFHGRKSS